MMLWFWILPKLLENFGRKTTPFTGFRGITCYLPSLMIGICYYHFCNGEGIGSFTLQNGIFLMIIKTLSFVCWTKMKLGRLNCLCSQNVSQVFDWPRSPGSLGLSRGPFILQPLFYKVVEKWSEKFGSRKVVDQKKRWFYTINPNFFWFKKSGWPEKKS